MFDGLDELLDTYRRREISHAVEAFANLYSPTSILVTSRKVGYREAPLAPNVFSTVLLEDFSDEEVGSYVARWFRLDDTLTAKEQDSLAKAFMAESRSIPDLRSNALVLSLQCVPGSKIHSPESCRTVRPMRPHAFRSMGCEPWGSRAGATQG